MISALVAGLSDPGPRHLARDIVLPLSSLVYKWVPAKLMLVGNPVMD